jgi:hypothetical protein
MLITMIRWFAQQPEGRFKVAGTWLTAKSDPISAEKQRRIVIQRTDLRSASPYSDRP